MTIIVVVRADQSEYGKGEGGTLASYKGAIYFTENSLKIAKSPSMVVVVVMMMINDNDDDDDNDDDGCGEGDEHFGGGGVRDCDDNDTADANM